MSAIFGIVTRNGEPVRDEELRHLTQASGSWGPDNTAVWSDGDAALGRCLRHDTPEDVDDRLPLAEGDRGIAFTAEGRIDNRDELLDALDCPCRRPRRHR